MIKLKVLLMLLFALGAVVAEAELPKSSYTRTMLKVSRSLPGETEEMKVRTSEGNFATLIVKKRDRSADSNNKSLEGKDNNSSTVRLDLLGSSSDQREDVKKSSEKAHVELIRAKINTDQRNESQLSQRIRESDYGNWSPVRASDDASSDVPYHNWRPVPLESPKAQEPTVNNVNGLLFARSFHQANNRQQKNLSNGQPTQYIYMQTNRALARTNIGANFGKNRDAKNVPPEVTVRTEIDVKTSAKRSPMTIDADGIPIIHGTRVPDEPIDKIQTWRNARVINNKLVTNSDPLELDASITKENYLENQRFENYFTNVNRRFGRNYEEENRNVYFEWDPYNYRQTDALRADVYETKNENVRSNIQKRMLQEGSPIYPNSQLYTPESQKIAPLALKPGARAPVRAPVLHYAHPELGVQPAKILKNEKRRPDNFPESQHSFTEQRHKKKYVLNDKNIVDSYTRKNYYPNQHFYGLKRPDTPLWIKISENLKNQLSSGVQKVSQVFDPLVEATQKISQNLGLTRGQDRAEDKIGTVASGSSILIPALGLVASGAALGIGAVAVGRYLEGTTVDFLKRSNEKALKPEQLMAMEAVHHQPQLQDDDVSIVDSRGERKLPQDDSVVIVAEENAANDKVALASQQTAGVRRRRSLDDLFRRGGRQVESEGVKNFQRKGADSILEVVEIDLPRRADDKVSSLVLQGNTLVENAKAVEQLFDSARKRRSLASDEELNDIFQNLERGESTEVAHVNGDWANTPCAKRVFCDAMVQRGSDAVIFMEKKMASLLGLIQPAASAQVSSHFEEVMEAVKRHDCSSFTCPSVRPGNLLL